MASLENLAQEPEDMASAVTDFLLELQRGGRKGSGQLGGPSLARMEHPHPQDTVGMGHGEMTVDWLVAVSNCCPTCN